MSRRQRNAGIVTSQQPPENSSGYFLGSGVNQFQAVQDPVTSPTSANPFIEEAQGLDKPQSPISI